MPIHRKKMDISWNKDYGKKEEVVKTCEMKYAIILLDRQNWFAYLLRYV